jgi:hypothetical protein
MAMESSRKSDNQGQKQVDINVDEFLKAQAFKRYAADSIKQKKLGEEFQKQYELGNQLVESRLADFQNALAKKYGEDKKIDMTTGEFK